MTDTTEKIETLTEDLTAAIEGKKVDAKGLASVASALAVFTARAGGFDDGDMAILKDRMDEQFDFMDEAWTLMQKEGDE